mgnify:FL=1
MINKITKQINEIEIELLNCKDNLDIDLLHKRNELVFKRNKQNINIRLTCNNKYYYANQCYRFTKHILENGFNNFDKDEIKKHGISFNKYSINNGYSQYHNDLKRFNSKDEMLGFVIGYNTANNI